MRQIAGQQLLLASSTTEGNRGGDLRNSAAAIETHEDRIKLERMATVISYAEAADGIVTTARRSPDAASGDQVLVVFLKNDYTLERQIGWDATLSKFMPVWNSTDSSATGSHAALQVRCATGIMVWLCIFG